MVSQPMNGVFRPPLEVLPRSEWDGHVNDRVTTGSGTALYLMTAHPSNVRAEQIIIGEDRNCRR